jgi:hypothetical protein
VCVAATPAFLNFVHDLPRPPSPVCLTECRRRAFVYLLPTLPRSEDLLRSRCSLTIMIASPSPQPRMDV